MAKITPAFHIPAFALSNLTLSAQSICNPPSKSAGVVFKLGRARQNLKHIYFDVHFLASIVTEKEATWHQSFPRIPLYLSRPTVVGVYLRESQLISHLNDSFQVLVSYGRFLVQYGLRTTPNMFARKK
jgi:hypothetical protein